MSHGKRTDPRRGVPAAKGDRRWQGRVGEQSYAPIVPTKAANRRTLYRALPLRRIYIPKEDRKKRPISIPALEDKIVQKTAVELLSAIYEQDFLDCSYGFRPGRGAHGALDEVGRVICCEQTSVVLELDIASYFDSIVREHLMEMIEKRVSDASVLRLYGRPPAPGRT